MWEKPHRKLMIQADFKFVLLHVGYRHTLKITKKKKKKIGGLVYTHGNGNKCSSSKFFNSGLNKMS